MMDYSVLDNRTKDIRRKVVQTAYERKKGHIGGALSIVDILVCLFEYCMNKNDKFILSKGHGCLSYFILLREKGYNPNMAGHPERDPENGIYCTTGSLGHGFPIGIGMALAKKIKKESGRIFILMSDAECQEGTTWESLLLGAHHKLSNLTIIIDNNKLQTLGKTSDILSFGDFESIGGAVNWDVQRINGHSFEEIIKAIEKKSYDKPKMIIADTVKGKGVSYMENVAMWHTAIPDEEQFKQAMKELE